MPKRFCLNSPRIFFSEISPRIFWAIKKQTITNFSRDFFQNFFKKTIKSSFDFIVIPWFFKFCMHFSKYFVRNLFIDSLRNSTKKCSRDCFGHLPSFLSKNIPRVSPEIPSRISWFFLSKLKFPRVFTRVPIKFLWSFFEDVEQLFFQEFFQKFLQG